MFFSSFLSWACMKTLHIFSCWPKLTGDDIKSCEVIYGWKLGCCAGSLSRNLKCPCNIQNLKSTNSFRIIKTFPRIPFTFQIISCNRNHLCPLLIHSTGFLLRSSHNILILVGAFYKRCLTLRIIFLFFLQPHIERSISRTQSVKIIFCSMALWPDG